MIGNALFALLIIVNSKADTTIKWSDTTQLTYADFAGAQAPLKDSVIKFDTLAVIDAEIDYRIDISMGKHRIHAHGVMYPEHSWIHAQLYPSNKSDSLMASPF